MADSNGIDSNQNIGKVELTPIIDEMQTSYLAYAMSVIVSRALPDVRDGLKPVQRRIVYAMHKMGYHHSGRFQKCASVTGETMKNYHPHGNIPIYDALVRMGQDFSMRYQLIEPQGNFGCFTKDTKIALTDGRNLNFEELIKEIEQGKINYTYSVNKLGLISIAEIKNPRLTIKKAELVKITLDNGEVIRCTPNHLFMLKDNSYKEARFLTPNDSLMPLYQKTSEETDSLNRKGYVLIYQPKTNNWVLAHHLADNYNLTTHKYSKSRGRVRHHLDFNKMNNNPDNVIRLGWSEHFQLHSNHASIQEYRQKIATGRNSYWSQPENRKKHSRLLSQRNIKSWQDPEYRNKMRQFLSQMNKAYIQNHPEKREVLSKRSHNTLIKLWQDPEYQAFMHKKIIKGNKNYSTNLTGKVKFLKICKQVMIHYIYLEENNYLKVRKTLYPSGAAPHWDTGLNKYFRNDVNLVRLELNGNHRISNIEVLDYQEDVYDLTIDGSHNFALAAGIFVHNSIDGDPPAAERYTECRLTGISDELLRDIDKNTVDFIDNYSGTTQEPVLLPSVIPNLLLNGAGGIAVGMATQIPPHNLGEVTDALIYLIDQNTLYQAKKKESPKNQADDVISVETPPANSDWTDGAQSTFAVTETGFHSEATVEDLMKFIKGPDFPTGASIYDHTQIQAAYATGKGRIVMRAKADIEETKSGRFDIIVTELPYQVNKAVLIGKIADLVKDKKLEGIAALRDESDRRGLRIVMELKRDAKPQSVLNNLYKHTAMQSVFNVNMVALSDGVPHLMTLKRILEEFIHHRQVVVRRRSEFELEEARARAHILEGLKIAVDNIDEVISIIRKSTDADEARTRLMAKFSLTAIQATAILDMQLRKLAALERQKIEDELKMVQEDIDYLVDLLGHPEKILRVIKDELLKIKDKYGDDRKTRVYKSKVGEFSEEDLVADETTIITVTKGGYVKRQSPMSFRTQNRGGKGVSGITTKEEDAVSHIFYTKTLDNLLFFTDRGRVFQIKVWEIPEASRIAKGQALVNLVNVEQGEKITAILASRKNDKIKFLFMCTTRGNVKKTSIEEYANIRKNGLISIKLDPGDELRWVVPTKDDDHLILVSRKGQSIRFDEKQVRPTHRDTSGVRGIMLGKEDTVVSMNLVADPKAELLVVMENGLGKKTRVDMWKLQGRGGSGIKAADVTSKTGEIVTAQIVDKDADTLVLTSNKGQLIKLNLHDVPSLQRQTQGVILMRTREGEKIAAATVVSSKDKTEDAASLEPLSEN